MAMSKASQAEAELESLAIGTIDPAIPPAPAGGAEVRMPRFIWRWENVVPLVLIVLGTIGAMQATGFRPRGAPFPLWTSIALVVFSAVLLVRGSLSTEARQGQIMDLGMVSRGADGASRRVQIIAGLFVMFFLVTLSFGLQYAAIAWAAVTPLVLMKSKTKWIAVAVAVGFVLLFVMFFANYLMGIIWPEPAFQTWLFN